MYQYEPVATQLEIDQCHKKDDNAEPMASLTSFARGTTSQHPKICNEGRPSFYPHSPEPLVVIGVMLNSESIQYRSRQSVPLWTCTAQSHRIRLSTLMFGSDAIRLRGGWVKADLHMVEQSLP